MACQDHWNPAGSAGGRMDQPAVLRAIRKAEGYLVDYRDFAADDDSNGPIFLLRALEDSQKWEDLTAQDVADALSNYAPREHGFFWWGGYGVSTEHTAYLNLQNGNIPMWYGQ